MPLADIFRIRLGHDRVRFARVRVGDAKISARVPPAFSVPDNVVGLVFDSAHVHVYADSRLVEGVA